MSDIDDKHMQILRSIDKFDKLGRDGVVALLQKPVEEFGAGLDPVSANLIGMFLDTRGATNEETLSNMQAYFERARLVRSRLELMGMLEETADADGATQWDRLLAMHPNKDETWADGGRPATIAWALDDMVYALRRMR